MITPASAFASLEAAGFTHVVWIPDSHLGTWNEALGKSPLSLIRVTREGEAVGVAIGLMLGGARPLVVIQCTGFFEAGDAIRNAAHDLRLPLKMIVGVRSLRAARAGKTNDNCPHFAEKLVAAWELPHTELDPEEVAEEELATVLRELAASQGPRIILWVE